MGCARKGLLKLFSSFTHLLVQFSKKGDSLSRENLPFTPYLSDLIGCIYSRIFHEDFWRRNMGNKKSQLTKAELEDYKELTYLTEREIQCAFTRFKNLHPKVLNRDKYARISTNIIKRMPEFQSNPFAERICEIFSSESDQCWSFEDFLDMVSVFSPSTPGDVKAEYAFNIYDFDGDGLLSEKDLLILMSLLKGNNQLEQDEMEDVVDRLMVEADIDQDGHLSLGEFKHILMKCPDFARSFTIRI